MAKRLLDIIISLILLLILSPIILLISVVVVCDTGFPVFYRGQRVGRYGRIFNVLKFRSMVADSRRKGPGITAESDQRITKCGRFLRKWKLDELPQFINVLRGDMSLVGPRPEDPQYVKDYNEEEKRVLSVKPGITGVSQILFRNEEELLNVDDPEEYYINCIMRQKLRVDLAYTQHQLISLDFLLIVFTVLVVLLPGKSEEICQRLCKRLNEDIYISYSYQK
ncbi:MAG TPA: sugar transferase [Clostridiaceae bacterium]|nr:sugar transferase [Clostridiaceae bacterium]